jgi:predicted RNase H-like nuclease (RuvC/YqgF family)
MAQELHVDPIITKLLKLVEEKDNKINELKSRIDGFSTKIQFMLERLNISIVEGRISAVNNNNFSSYEIKIDKLVRRLDLLENNLFQYFRNK